MSKIINPELKSEKENFIDAILSQVVKKNLHKLIHQNPGGSAKSH